MEMFRFFAHIATQQQQPQPIEYNIRYNVINGHYQGASHITGDITIIVHIYANTGYKLPSSITATNCRYYYNQNTGDIQLSDATGDITITAICEQEQQEQVFVQPVLTENGTMGGNDFAVNASASASSAYKAFDNDSSTYWSATATGYSDLVFYNPNGLKVSSLLFTWYSSSTTYVGKTIVVYGSDDNSTWTELVSSEYVAGATRTVDVNSSNFYKYHKVSIEKYGATVFAGGTRLVQLDIIATYIGQPTTSYSITKQITNGTATGDTEINVGQTAIVTISANSGYTLPNSITVNNASYTYNSSTGVITLSNPTGDVIIKAICEAEEEQFVRPNLTANGTLGGREFAVTADVNTSTAYQAVDSSSTTYWNSGMGADGNYIFYNPNALKVSKLTVVWTSSTYAGGTITVYGSNNNSTYTKLISSSAATTETQRVINVNSSVFYKYYKLLIQYKTTRYATRMSNLLIEATYI